MFGRLPETVRGWFRRPKCEACGAPSVGFFALSSRSHGRDAGGRPVTTFRVRTVRALCKTCLETAEGEAERGDQD
jgi:hypothetical protein